MFAYNNNNAATNYPVQAATATTILAPGYYMETYPTASLQPSYQQNTQFVLSPMLQITPMIPPTQQQQQYQYQHQQQQTIQSSPSMGHLYSSSSSSSNSNSMTQLPSLQNVLNSGATTPTNTIDHFTKSESTTNFNLNLKANNNNNNNTNNTHLLTPNSSTRASSALSSPALTPIMLPPISTVASNNTNYISSSSSSSSQQLHLPSLTTQFQNNQVTTLTAKPLPPSNIHSLVNSGRTTPTKNIPPAIIIKEENNNNNNDTRQPELKKNFPFITQNNILNINKNIITTKKQPKTLTITNNKQQQQHSTPTRKRRRTTKEQRQILKDAFNKNKAPSKEERLSLAAKCNMTEKSIQVWFQNQRQYLRREQNLRALQCFQIIG